MTSESWLAGRREWLVVVGIAVLGMAVASVGIWLFPADVSAYKQAAEVTATGAEPVVPAPFIPVAIVVMLLHIVTLSGGEAEG